MSLPDSSRRLEAMQAEMQLEALPGYLQYWEDRAHNNPNDERVMRIVTGLTHIAIRGEEGHAEYTDRSPALQARYWYRALGPLNPMQGIEPDLAAAASMMYEKSTPDPAESANLTLDSAYAFCELARVTTRETTRRDALLFAMDVVKTIKEDPDFDARDAKYRLQTTILDDDLRHELVRLGHTGTLDPKPLDVKTYRAFERDFAQLELRGIEVFAQQVGGGITDENLGVLFESYYIKARRHEAWRDEEIDTVKVRGATSRENAEWTGEYDVDPNRITGNHDVVITSYRGDEPAQDDRIQLKVVKGATTYHSRVVVQDFEEIMDRRFGTIDGATSELSRSLVRIRSHYRDMLDRS